MARPALDVNTFVAGDVLAELAQAAGIRDSIGARQFQTNTAAAAAVGKVVAERALAAGIEAVVFDRGAYRYHGRVKALADAAREAGLQF